MGGFIAALNNYTMVQAKRMNGGGSMIDFKNATYAKLKQVNFDVFRDRIEPLLTQDERIVVTFQGIRDGLVFTTKRVISINVQGITGKKIDYTSLPYSKVQAFSVETSGIVDLDSELELWFSGLGKVKFEFVSGFDVTRLSSILAKFIL